MSMVRAKAFTLVELMITIGIIITVAGLVTGFVAAMAAGTKSEEAANTVNGYLQMARQQAVQYGADLAVFFLPPTKYSWNTRMVIFEVRPKMTIDRDISHWQVLMASRTGELPFNVGVKNAQGDDCFPIIFSGQGFVHPACSDSDLSIVIGPTTTEATEKRDRPKIVAINRATGAVMRFDRVP